MSWNEEKKYYLLREIGGKKIHAAYHSGLAFGRLYFDWANALYSIPLSEIRKNAASLDNARKENFPEGKIFGIMSDGSNILALVRNGEKAELLRQVDGVWNKESELDISSPIASCAYDKGFFFCETNPKKTAAIYHWTQKQGLRTVARFDEPLKIYSLVIKDGKLRLAVSGNDSRLLEAQLSQIGDKMLALADFSITKLPFSVFKELGLPGGAPLFSIDGATQIVREDGSRVWEDIKAGECGKQIAASAVLDGRLGIIGSWRRDTAHPAACLYIFDGERPIYKWTVKSEDPESLRWTGYETSQSGLSGAELFIPCYGGNFLHLRKAAKAEERIGATILAENKDFTLLGKLSPPTTAKGTEKASVNTLLFENPARDLGNIWRGQNYYPDNQSQKASVYLTFDVEQHLPGKPYCLTGGDLPEKPGIFWIMDALESNGLRGTFFVNIYEFENFDPGFMENLLQEIDRRGHEAGLHCHTSMKTDTALDFNKIPLGRLSRPEQLKILEYGTEFIQKAIGKAPVSFRSGAYSINDATLDVLEELGYKVDSSVFISQMGSQADFKYFTRNKPAWHGKLLELPVTSIRWDGKPSKLDINWLASSQNMMAALSMCRKEGLDQLVTMAHSFSFINFTQNPEASITDFKFTSNRYIAGVNKKLQNEYALFLKSLAESREYEVRLLRDAPSLIEENDRPDLVPEYHSLPKNALICPICGYQGFFQPYRGRENAQCPACGSLERMRLKNLYMKKYLRLNDGRKLSVLHAGPHMVTSAWLKSLPNLEYISSDPYNEADYHFPLEKIPFVEASFDLVIAIGVLMHLLDDDKAIEEIGRVLKPQGQLLLWFGKLKSEITTEMYDREKFKDMQAHDFSTPANVVGGKLIEKDGQILYNPRFATRVYGKDIINKLRDKGFAVQCVEASGIVDDPAKFGIDGDDLMIVCAKE